MASFWAYPRRGLPRPIFGLLREEPALTMGYPGRSYRTWQQSDQFYRNLFDEAPSAFFSVGTEGRIRKANRRALQLLGYQSDEIIARCFLDLYARGPTGKVKALEVFRKFCAGSEIQGQELEMRCADGTGMWVRLSVQPIRDAHGQVVASCSMVQEIGQPTPLGHDLHRYHRGETSTLTTLTDDTAEKYLERLCVKSSGCTLFLDMNQIDWFGAAGNYIELHVGARLYLLRHTMHDLERALDPCRFLRIHRAAIVNVERIKGLRVRSWGNHDVILRDGTQLILSRGYRRKLRGLLGKALQVKCV